MARTLIGQRIRDLRKAAGLTQAALAQSVGISPSYLNLIEGDRRNIAGLLLHRIADALQRPLEDFDGAAERRLAQDLAEVAADAQLAPLRIAPASAPELVAGHPAWARALVTLHRSGIDQQRAVGALSDRLSHDPFVGDAVHSLLTNLTAIRSASEILETVDDLEAAQRRRFVGMIAQDSRRLSEVAQALAGFLGNARIPGRAVTPGESVDDFIADRGNHFPALEGAAEDLARVVGAEPARAEAALAAYVRGAHGVEVRWVREAQGLAPARFDAQARVLELSELASPTTRQFALARTAVEFACAAAVTGELEASGLDGPAARRRAQAMLLSYAAGAFLMPYQAFLPEAAQARHDVDLLARRFGVSFEQAAHRLTTLRRPGAEGLPFGFLRADPAGYVTKRLPLPGLPLPRYGGACPLWPVYTAGRGADTVRRLVVFPGGDRYLMVARALAKDAGRQTGPRMLSVMLICDALHADRTVYGDGLDLSPAAPALPVGPACRVCVRRDCGWRQEDPILDAGMY